MSIAQKKCPRKRNVESCGLHVYQKCPVSSKVSCVEKVPQAERTILVCGTEGGDLCVLSVGMADEMVKHSERKVNPLSAAPHPEITSIHRYNEELCVGSSDGTVTLLKANDLLSSAQGRINWKADPTCVNDVSIWDEAIVVTAASSANPVRMWDTRQQQPKQAMQLDNPKSFGATYHSVCSMPGERRWVAASNSEGEVCIWDCRKPQQPLHSQFAHKADVWKVRFDPSHLSQLYSTGDDGALMQWRYTLPRHDSTPLVQSINQGRSNSFTSLDIDQDTQMLLATSTSGSILVCPSA